MNASQLTGIVRIVLGAISGVTGTLGILKGVDWVAITSALVAIIPLVWTYFTHSTPAMIETVAESPVVKKVVVTSPALAMAIPNTKVVS